MSLKHIIGQKKAIGMLLGAVGRRRIASSYLFCGESGIGKKTTAINFAKALNCHTNISGFVSRDRGESLSGDPETGTGNSEHVSFDACDECPSCAKIDGGSHPDFILLSPEDGQIKIDDIRKIDEALSFKPFEARKKVVVVDDAEKMNTPAANAFLKTLEEPPEESLIILVSSRPDLLLPTIRSRCSRINFSPLSPELCRQVLRGKLKEDELELASRLSMGRPGAVLSSDLAAERSWFTGLFKGMFHSGKDGWASREDMERWFELALSVFRDMAVLKITGGTERLINIDLAEYLASLSKSVDLNVIINIYRELVLLKGLLMFNLNRSITWNYTSSVLRKEIGTGNG